MSGLLSRMWMLLVAGLPLSTAHRVAERVGRRRWQVDRAGEAERLQAAVMSRLDVSEAEAVPIVRMIFERSTIAQLNEALFRIKPRQRIAELVEIRGKHLLDRALKSGKGCVLCSGHFHGRWSLLAGLGLRGYRPMLVRQAAPKMDRVPAWFQRRFDTMFSSRFGCAYAWMGTPSPFSGAAASAHLRRNGVLVNLIDVSSHTDRLVEVDFLGRKERFPVGPVILSQLAGAPLLVFAIHYSRVDRKYVCEIEEVDLRSRDGGESIQHAAARIEAGIRSHPEDWAGWRKSHYLGAHDRRSGQLTKVATQNSPSWEPHPDGTPCTPRTTPPVR